MTDPWQIYSLTLGDLKLLCLPGIGGRLWDVVFAGQSLLFQNPDLIGASADFNALGTLPTRSPQFGFPLWGGEKTWIAPDSDWPDGAPFPILDSGPYRVTHSDGHRLEMRSSTCPVSRLQIERQITLHTTTSWSIRHSVTNHGPSPRHTGIWSVLMLNHPAYIWLETGQTGPANPVFGDPADHMGHLGTLATFRCDLQREFKLGAQNPTGRVLIALGNSPSRLWLSCTTEPHEAGERFAHGHNFEVFNSGDYAYCEAEWHSSLCNLAPKKSLSFNQLFTIGSETDLLSRSTTSLKELELFSCKS